jgi:peptidoglycan hydrolase CwlO-like protein
MRYTLLIFLLTIVSPMQAQQLDSLFNRLPLDTVLVARVDALDSIQHSFYGKSDSLKQEYKSKFNSIDSTRAGLQSKIDSLNTLQLPTDKYTHKLDSVIQQREKAVASLNDKMDDLKSKATDKINKLELSPSCKVKPMH